MRRLLVLALLASAACDDGNTHPEDAPAAAPAPGGGGAAPGGGGDGGGGAPAPAPAPAPGGGIPVSTGAPPDTVDPDVPLSTTYHAPQVASGQAYWRLVTIEYYPPAVSATVGGDHHIFFKALDFDGTPLEGQTARSTVFGNTAYADTKAAVDQYWGNFPMFGTNWCSPDINDSPGPYSVEMTQDNLPSYRVEGMGMHCNHHSTWRLVFQKVVAP